VCGECARVRKKGVFEPVRNRLPIEYRGEKDFDLRGPADLLAATDPTRYERLLEFELKKRLPELLSAALKHPDTPTA